MPKGANEGSAIMNASRLSAVTAVAAGLLSGASAARAADYAEVISATPVTTSIVVPRQECADVEQLVQRQPSGGGALIGAIVGGVVGNQFGHGMGRAAATGLGAIAGSAIGNNVEGSNGGTATVASRRCRTVSSYDSRVVGYDVVYDYNGQRYTTRMAQDPGNRLAIDVRPAMQAPLDRVGPPVTRSYGPPAQISSHPVDAQPTYIESAPALAPAYSYYYPAPVTYYEPAPAPVYYGGPGAYVGPAIIGAGIGYWIGSSWHRGYRDGYYGGGRRWR